MQKAIFNWSGGKDSSLALFKALQMPDIEIVGLLTTHNAENGRVSMHGVPADLVQEQARLLDLPLFVLNIEPSASMEIYNEVMRKAWADFAQQGITTAIFGDIFLEDLRRYREEKLAEVGIKAIFPLWGMSSEAVLQELWSNGFETITVCVSEAKLGEAFVGKVLDAAFVANLPAGVDACGENGEYHTFVYRAPFFRQDIPIVVRDRVRKTYASPDGTWESAFWYADLQLAYADK